MKYNVCKINGCERRVYGNGHCKAHYMRIKRTGHHGSVEIKKYSANTQRNSVIEFIETTVLTWNSNDCLLWPFSKTKQGYAMMAIGGTSKIASRYVCEQAHGSPTEAGLHAAHSCGNGDKGCVNPMHLSWKTPAENSADKIIHGTTLRGSSNPSSKLTEAQVRRIREMRGKLTQKQLSVQFGVSETAIASIHKSNKWAWLR